MVTIFLIQVSEDPGAEEEGVHTGEQEDVRGDKPEGDRPPVPRRPGQGGRHGAAPRQAQEH